MSKPCCAIIDGSTRIYGEISGNVVCRGNAVVLPGTKLDNRTQDCFVLEDDSVSVQTASRTPPRKNPVPMILNDKTKGRCL